MAWPKGKPNPRAFKRQNVIQESKPTIEPDLPVSEKLSEVIRQLKAVLISYRHDIETTVTEQGNQTTAIVVKISFPCR